MIVAEEKEDGILIRPVVVVPVEIQFRAKAEFLLANVANQADYRKARRRLSATSAWTPIRFPTGACNRSRLFLDANVLFSAAYLPDTALLRLCI
jgi:hypothetical protein